MANSLNNDNFLINLKELASKNSLDLSELKEIIHFCGNFFSQDLPQQFDKSFNLPFLVQGFSGKTFKLVKSNKIEAQQKLIAEISQDQSLKSEQKEKIIAELKKQQDKILEENIFVSDLLAFLEQSSILLAKFFNQNNKQALAKIGNDFFNRVGLAPKASSQQILLKELEKIEKNPSVWQKVNTDLVQTMLNIIEEQEKSARKQKDSDQEEDDTASTGAQLSQQPSKKNLEAKQDQDHEGDEKDVQQTLPEDFSKEFNLARLDDHSKLYIRSLAIISVNQALQFQFANLSKEQLINMGFDEIPNFNQLSLTSRQELLSLAFSKIETLLASGRYDLEDLINTPSLRISFTKDVALRVMTDIRGGEVFARELGKLTESNQDLAQIKEQLTKNQQQNFNQQLLDAKFSVRSSAIPEDLKEQLAGLTTEEAEAFFAKLDSKNNLKNDFLANIKKSFTRVTKNNFLAEWKKIVANDKSAIDKSFLAQENILPIIDVFIQQNYPVAYVENFDWPRFQAHFGRDLISQNTYLANERVIKDLLSSYWKSQRAEWSRTIHQGIDNEFYKPEDIEKLWTEFNSVGKQQRVNKNYKPSSKSPLIQRPSNTQTIGQTTTDKEFEFPNNLSKADKKIVQKQAVYLQQLKQQAIFNIVDAEAVTKKLAGFTQDQIAFDRFNEEQIKNFNKLIGVYKQNFLNVINSSGPRTQTVTLNYYLPGEEYSLDNVALQADTLPQFSPYDLGAINYNQAFGDRETNEYPLVRSHNKEGGIESRLQEGFAAVKNVANQAIDFVGEKAVRAGLNYATGGSFEALPEPVKKMVEQVAWGTIKKTLEPILKIALVLTLAAFGALIALVFKVVSFFTGGGGAKEASTVLKQKNIPSTEATSAKQSASTVKDAPVAENQLAERTSAIETQNAAKVQAKAAKPLPKSGVAQFGKGVMATASQAVITAFGLAAGSTILYEAVINGAFLTQFPTGGTSGGGAVYCNDVLVGNLTYYSQKDYRDIHICGDPGCQFGDVACGPTSVAMILNEDPVQMSIREGYLYCGKTTCSGSSFRSLIDTLNSNGVPTSVVPLSGGSPTQVTDEISQYLAEGNVILARTETHRIGHFYIIVCVESPGTVTAWDPWYGKDVVHQVGSDTIITDIALVQN